MRRLGGFLGRGKIRSTRRRLRSTPRSKVTHFEPLEARQLLAGDLLHSLAYAEGNLGTADAESLVRLTVSGGSAIVGFRMHATGGTLDPDRLGIETVSGLTIAPVLSRADINSAGDSLLLAELGPGTYNIVVQGEGTTTGTFRVDAFLPGDQSCDGRVNDSELLWATAAVIQAEGGWNQMTALFYKAQGIDLAGPSLYRQAYDSDLDGDVDNLDLGRIDSNHGRARVTLTLVSDMECPQLAAALVQDTGRSATDGITNELAIAGHLQDASPIAWFRAGFDDAPEASYVNVLAEVNASGDFTFDLARLEQIFGGPLANTGAHTLHLIAQDTIGNAQPARIHVPFTLDTIAPDAPTGLDLVASSDLGYYDDDNITADTTPTLAAEAETQALVQFYAADVLVGEGVATSPVSVTTTELVDGDHVLTATATDLAGNVSGPSDPLTITIVTVLPEEPIFALAAASDTGEPGDDLTSLTLVTLEGIADTGLRVTLENTGAVTTSDGSTGAFSFADVPLVYGANVLTVTAMDLAGNTRSYTRTITQNNAPTVAGALAPEVDEDDSPTYHDLTGLFTDLNLADGDTLTLSIVGNTNADLLTATVEDGDGSAQIINGQLKLVLVANAFGTATITVRATDSFGESVEADVVVTVAPVNDAPTASATTLFVEENTFVDLDLRTKVSDLETTNKDDLVFEVSDPLNGTIQLLADGHTARFTPTPNFNGVAAFKYKVTDTGVVGGDELSAQTTVNVSVTPFNDPPVANTTTLEVTEDVPNTIDLRTLVSDTETTNPNNFTFEILSDEHGTAILLEDGHTAQFTPDPDYNGPASFTYRVTDTGDGQAPLKSAEATIAVTVLPVNDDPTAADHEYTMGEDESLPADDGRNLLADSSDPDASDTLSVVAGVVTSTQGVEVTIHADGTFTYDPGDTFNYLAVGETATDTFTYTISDGHGGTDTATVTITITGANDNPVGVAHEYGMGEDESLPADDGRNLLAGASDPDASDTLSVVASTVTSTEHVEVTIHADGTFTYDPGDTFNYLGEGETETDTFEYTINDGHGGTHTATVTITITGANDNPVAVAHEYGMGEDESLPADAGRNLLAGASDPDTSDTTFTIIDGTVTSTQGVEVTIHADGTFDYNPGDKFNYLAVGETATDTFEYTISDGHGGTNTATVTITITGANDVPTAVADTYTIGEDESLSPTVAEGLLANDIEPDASDELVAVAETVTTAQLLSVTINADGTFTYDPGDTFNYLGEGETATDTFQYTIVDGHGGQSTATVTITIIGANDAPVAEDKDYSVGEDDSLPPDAGRNLLAGASDPDVSDTISIVDGVVTSAEGIAVTINTDGTFTYDPGDVFDYLIDGDAKANDSFTYTVTDTHGGSVTRTVYIEISGANDVPTAVNDELNASNSQPTTLDVLANDTDVDSGDVLVIDSVTQGSQGGTVTISGDGKSIIYEPGSLAGSEGTETFTYTIRDLAGATSTAEVTVNVLANNAPVAHDDTGQTDEDTIRSILAPEGLLQNDTDLDPGDVLTVTGYQAQSHLGAVVYVGPDGDYTYDPRGAIALQSLAEGSEPVVDWFEYTISDGRGGTDTGCVYITVTGVNDAPLAVDQTINNANEDTEVQGNVLAGATDVDTGETATLQAVTFEGALPSGAMLTINADGSFVYDPRGVEALQALAVNEYFDDSFEFTIYDVHGAQHSAHVYIRVNGANDAPSAVGDEYEIFEDGSLPANDERNLLANDLDPDTNDSHTAVAGVVTSSEGVTVTIYQDGTFSYEPGTKFNHLAKDAVVYDYFSYTIRDAGGLEDNTGTVTIKITGTNDAPTADDDPDNETNESTAIDINVLDGDTDPDDGAVLFVSGFDATSAEGATITLNQDGTLHYNPTTSAFLQGLTTGEDWTDTFQYTVSDQHGGTHTATVSVLVHGQSGAPMLIGTIGDMTLTDASSPQPDDIDLDTIFSDPDGDGLTFNVTSSNPALVSVEIVEGHLLRVRYLPYDQTVDRTPATIQVTATDDSPDHLQATHDFTVTVLPQYLVEFQLVVLAAPSAGGQMATLPDSLTEVVQGTQYVVEIWVRDLWDDTVSGGPSPGFTGAEMDMRFNPALAQAALVSHDPLFMGATSGSADNVNGLIDEFSGGSGTTGGLAVGKYARLGYVTFDATNVGQQEFSLEEIGPVSRIGLGAINVAQVHAIGATVNQVVEQNTVDFVVDADVSNFAFSVVVGGQTMVATVPFSDYGFSPSGTLQLIVDDLNNPTQLQIVTGFVDFEESLAGPFAPAVGGGSGTAPADLAFLDALTNGVIIKLAIRELMMSFSMSAPVAVVSGGFSSDVVSIGLGQGFGDIRNTLSVSERESLQGLTSTVEDTRYATWSTSGSDHDLNIDFNRRINLSGLFGANSYMIVSGNVFVTHTSGAPLMGTQTAEPDTGVLVTLVKQPTAVDADGCVDALPANEQWIDEWTTFWVEVWARTDQDAGVGAARVDLLYNGDYFTATEVDHGGVYVQNPSGDISQDGRVLALGGMTTLAGRGAEGYVLVGRVKFQSLDGDQVPLDADSKVLAPHNLGLEVENVQMTLADGQAVDAGVGRMPRTELWAVPYDVDDSGRIDVADLSFFAPAYRQDVVGSDAPFIWSVDYDHSGRVDLGDLSFFAANYRKSKAGGEEIVYPDTFPRRWVGSQLDLEGADSVGDVLDAAIDQWTQQLGLDAPIEIQLVVKDFGTNQLGEGEILEVNADGVPIRGRITLDDDAAGLGWYSQIDVDGQFEQYDLYTVLLHEIGHALGFMYNYDGFASYVQSDGQGGWVFVTSELNVPLDAAAQHLGAQTYADDVMSPYLSPGVRKAVSELDAQILLAAYEAAEGGAGGFAPLAVPLLAGQTAGASVSTADVTPILATLEGDATWERLLGRPVGWDAPSADRAIHAEAIDSIHAAAAVVLDKTDAVRPLGQRLRRAWADGEPTDGWAEEELAAAFADTQRDDAHQTLDALWAQWTLSADERLRDV